MYLLYAMGIAGLIVALYLFPTMAAFADTIPHLIRNAVLFAFRNVGFLVVIVFFQVFPQVLTYTDTQMLPLYGFIWVTCGYSLVVLLCATLLLKLYTPYLPLVDAYGDFILDENGDVIRVDQAEGRRPAEGGGAAEKTEAEILEEMKKLGM